MAPWKVSTNSSLKVGPPISIRKSKRINTANLQTKSCDTVVQCPKAKPCLQSSLQGLTDKEYKEQNLDSFQSKVVMLKSGGKMNWPMALQQLHPGVITMEDIADEGGCDQSAPPPSTPSGPTAKDTQQTDSKHDEKAVEDAVQNTLEANSHIPDTCDHPGATIPHTAACILDTVAHHSHEGAGMDGQDIDD
ncbi:hypothetical protein EDC04DRAFT_2606467 [Pisolithus marmoratus]|nr:hypothetical protein EDC04DRAFT_2606467 [Pisolithus marmoratus]